MTESWQVIPLVMATGGTMGGNIFNSVVLPNLSQEQRDILAASGVESLRIDGLGNIREYVYKDDQDRTKTA